MGSNEGPSKSDWEESRKKPACGEHCEHVHGDQAPTEDELTIDRLNSIYEKSRERVRDLEACCSRLQAQIQEAATIEREACGEIADELRCGSDCNWTNCAADRCCAARHIAEHIRARGGA